MSYTPTEWKKGDVVTATKLNNIETGITGLESAIPEASTVKILNLEVSETVNNGNYTVTVVHQDFDANELFSEVFAYWQGTKETVFPAFVAVVTNPTGEWSAVVPLYVKENNEMYRYEITGNATSLSLASYSNQVGAVQNDYQVVIEMGYSASEATVSVYHRYASFALTPYTD